MKVSFKTKRPARIPKHAWHICLYTDVNSLSGVDSVSEEIHSLASHATNGAVRAIDGKAQNWILCQLETDNSKPVSTTAEAIFSQLPNDCQNLVLYVSLPLDFPELERALETIFIRLILNGYRVDKFREENISDHQLRSVTVLTPEGYSELAKSVWSYAAALSEGRRFAMDLVNAPSNYKTPEMIAGIVSKRARKSGYRCKVFDKKAIGKLGLSALLAVNQGSTLPPRFLIVE
ncbi:MAG: hypothetical protein AAFP70_17880, partial [Calditrichota bacterium]